MKLPKISLSQWILPIVAIALLAANGLLIYQNKSLRAAVARSKQLVTDVGYRFDRLPATSLEGLEAPLIFGDDGKNTVLLVFNTNCEYCEQQYPYWRTLAGSIDRTKWRVVAVTSQSQTELIGKHLEEKGLAGLADVRVVSPQDGFRSRMGFTPMTIAVDSDGVVKKVWPGLWTEGFDLAF